MSTTKSTKKIYIISLTIILVVIAIIAILLRNNNTSKIIVNNEESKQLINTNALTMMYETEAGSGEYQIFTNTTWPQDGYTFNEGLSSCENGSTLTWDDERKAVILSTNVSDKCYVYFDKEPEIVYFADYIIDNVYVEDGVNELYYHDGVGTYTNANQEAGDNSYRYAGANPNNYVCFGNDETMCPADNLYRIIGVFGNQIKLIKHDYAESNLLGTDGDFGETIDGLDSYHWNKSNGKVWSNSALNTINLNTNYINALGSEWSSKIAEHTWQVGGVASANVYSSPVKTTHTYEVGASAANTTYQAKIGLMYVSDYGYAASPANWSTNMGNLDNATNLDNNWLCSSSLMEWTISYNLDSSYGVFLIWDGGSVFETSFNDYLGVRPSFYLESTVTYISGSGTQSDPFRIA